MKRKFLYFFIIALIFSCSPKTDVSNYLIFSDIFKYDTISRNEIIKALTTNKKYPYTKKQADKLADIIIQKRKKNAANTILYCRIVLNMI